MISIRACPRIAPCNNPKCKDRACKDPAHCEDWIEYIRKEKRMRGE